MNYTLEEVNLMDKIFKIKFGNPGMSYSNSYFTVEFNISNQSFEYVHNHMCEIAEDLGLVKLVTSNDGSHHILRFEEIPCQKFIDSGGFQNHLDMVSAQKTNDSEHLVNQREKLKDDLKPWYRKGEIVIPMSLSAIALGLSLFQLYASNTNELTREDVQLMIEESVKEKDVIVIENKDSSLDSNSHSLK